MKILGSNRSARRPDHRDTSSRAQGSAQGSNHTTPTNHPHSRGPNENRTTGPNNQVMEINDKQKRKARTRRPRGGTGTNQPPTTTTTTTTLQNGCDSGHC